MFRALSLFMARYYQERFSGQDFGDSGYLRFVIKAT
jgi:hypothetical protein